MNKVCDAADWFAPGFLGIVRDELREPARFHRKQWEFAVLFRALRDAGALTGRLRGLSLGGGRERLLYSLAHHVSEIVVTDLYDAASLWEESRTSDPDAFVRENPPFPVDQSRISARRMDMRQIEFEDESFDFAYSSCAIEHIGDDDDFVRHLREVRRVLRPGGVYALTTELGYGPELIPHPGDYVFSIEHLEMLLRRSGLVWDEEIDASLAPHEANQPLPCSLGDVLDESVRASVAAWDERVPHLQLLRGRHPHTSALLLLRKASGESDGRTLRAKGIDASLAFLEEAVESLRRGFAAGTTRLNPFGLGGARSDADDQTVFHTTYQWLGAGSRELSVRVSPEEGSPSSLELRVHSFRTLGRVDVDCVAAQNVRLRGKRVTALVPITLEDDRCYAVLAHRLSGTGRIHDIDVRLDGIGVTRAH